ncbi:hypothetical protein Tco_0228029 [Tanacetum coccineum]
MRKVSSSSSDGGTMNYFPLKLIEIGFLDLGDCELELLHVDFWHISRGKEGLVESSVLDDVKDDLVSLFLLSHTGINPQVCGTDLDSDTRRCATITLLLLLLLPVFLAFQETYFSFQANILMSIFCSNALVKISAS